MTPEEIAAQNAKKAKDDADGKGDGDGKKATPPDSQQGKKKAAGDKADGEGEDEGLSPEVEAWLKTDAGKKWLDSQSASVRKATEQDIARKNKLAADKKKEDDEAEDLKKKGEHEKLAAQEKVKREAAELNALRLEVAIDKNLSNPKVAAKRLVGTTREELEADADELVKAGWGKPADDEDDDAEGKDGKKTTKPAYPFTPKGGKKPTTQPTEKSIAEEQSKVAAEIGTGIYPGARF